MAARSIASLSLSFGLVSIPVKVYLATEPASAIRFKWMAAGGARLRQQYVADPATADPEAMQDVDDDEPAAPAPEAPTSFRASFAPVPPVTIRVAARDVPEVPDEPYVVERREMLKGYEFEKGRFVLFTPEELKALQSQSRTTIDIVAFIPEGAVDPIYYDKSYYLAPDKRGAKPYSLLRKAMRETGHVALARWAWRSKEYVVQIRPAEHGLVLQQLLYADEVRDLAKLDIDLLEVNEAELALAKKLIEQTAQPAYDPTQFVDEEKQRILEAVERKIAGRRVVAPRTPETAVASGAQVVDLMEALRASLQTAAKQNKVKPAAKAASERKPARRASGGTAVEPKRRAAR